MTFSVVTSVREHRPRLLQPHDSGSRSSTCAKPVAGDTHTLTGTGGARRTPVIVLDAPAALEVLLRTPAAVDVEERLFKPGETLHAPHMIDVEVAQVLRRYATAGQIAREQQHGAR